MKLIFDLTKTQPIGDIKIHGGGKYGEIIFNSLVKRTTNIIVYYDPNKWLNPEIEKLCKINNLLLIDAAQKTISEVALENKGVIYSPIIENNINGISNDVVYITTIHGLRVLELPNDKYRSYFKNRYLRGIYSLYYNWKAEKDYIDTLHWYRRIFNRNKMHVVTVSEHSKASILSFIPSLKASDVKVFYSPSTIDNIKENVVPFSNEKYYLIVSANRWIKNAFRAIMAFDEIFTEHPEFKGTVILTGCSNKSLFTKHITNLSRFTFLDYVDDQLLSSLYKGAYLFVYPSLNEGFGYPPIESMAHGTPVIASAISSIPEICGNSVLYFNPIITSEIKMRILQMEDQFLRNQFIEKIKIRFKEIKAIQDDDLDKMVKYILSFLD